MKGITKIIRHYLLLSVGVALLLLLINFVIMMCWISSSMQYTHADYTLEKLSNGLVKEGDNFTLSAEAGEIINKDCEWAMLLDDAGHVIWSMNLPSDMPLSFSSSEIAGFSKWYLKDYPVYVWTHDNGLFVVANSKGSVWKMQLEAPEKMMRNLPAWLLIILISNFLGAILLALLLGIRFFRSFREIVLGIETLSQKQPAHLHTKGILKDLASNINTASQELIRQQKLIEKRDIARNSWITGVSHDIRTPLSMIMGYSSSLENESCFPEDYTRQFSIIRSQSERIKSLVDDLNLAVKLEYEMQPLNIKPFYLSELLRKVVVEYLNTLCNEKYMIILNISDETQSYLLKGDSGLFERALHNIIDNSMKHNPEGCEIFITLAQKGGRCLLEIKDTGIGFDDAVLEKLNHTSEMPTGVSHGIGLFIVKQIAIVSGAQICYCNWMQGSCISLKLP